MKVSFKELQKELEIALSEKEDFKFKCMDLEKHLELQVMLAKPKKLNL
jgi:hypothetical protein